MSGRSFGVVAGLLVDAAAPKEAMKPTFQEALDFLQVKASEAIRLAGSADGISPQLVICLGSSDENKLKGQTLALSAAVQSCYEASEELMLKVDATVVVAADPKKTPTESLVDALREVGGTGDELVDQQAQNIQKVDLASMPERVKVSCLGGTFDRLHAGHKLLLTMTGLLGENMRIGLSGDGTKLVTGKTHQDLLEPYGFREERVREFLSVACPHLQGGWVKIDQLEDAYGPSLLPDVGVLVVSEETKSGGPAVNKKRVEVGVSELKLVTVGLVGAGDGGEKLSSTMLREQDAKGGASAQSCL